MVNRLLARWCKNGAVIYKDKHIERSSDNMSDIDEVKVLNVEVFFDPSEVCPSIYLASCGVTGYVSSSFRCASIKDLVADCAHFL